ncbi:MAG: hypothetical protein RTU92_08205, partial [Candidatus Thorarchaeota archaeon]
MNSKSRIYFLAALAVFLMLPAVNNTSLPTSVTPVVDNALGNTDYQIAGNPDAADWWNSSFIYRRYVNVTEPGMADRNLVPVHLYLEFENGHCYQESIRVLYYTDPDSVELPFQIWNTTYDTSGYFILSTRVSFMVNVTLDSYDENYFIYYAKEDVGSVSYPNFYPFIYKSYTYSLINIASYYDGNNYIVEKWDSSTESWVDPRTGPPIVDYRWYNSQVTPSNVPSGTLNAYEVVRYEPTAYSNTVGYFWGTYAVYSNYPMAVSMGQGDEGSNSAINDWFPGVDQLGSGVGTEFVLGGIEGFDSHTEGKYWIQAIADNTEVNVYTSLLVEDSGWVFYNGTAVSSWPAILYEGEYISKRDVVYSNYMYVNSTVPVITRQGDVDAAYSRDVMGFYPDITGALAGEEFYMIDMGNSNDRFRVTNLGDTSVTAQYRRNSGTGWSTWTSTGSIGPNASVLLTVGVASDSNPEDIFHVQGPVGSMLMIEGIYNPTSMNNDEGDWAPTTTGDRFGTTFKLWGFRSWKFMITATEATEVTISGYNGGTITIPAGGASEFRPLSPSPSLYHVVSNASIGIVDVGKFSTSSPYAPTGDTGYGWQVPVYTPEQDQNGISVVLSDERHLFEFDISVVDVDGFAVEDASVGLYIPGTGDLWEDDNTRTRTGLTDANGLIVFEGLNNETYEVRVEINAKTWLTTQFPFVMIRNYSEHTITGSVTPLTIELPMGSFDVHYEDKMGAALVQTADETTTIRVSNITDGSGTGASYLDQATTNSTGWASFYRLPVNDYSFFVDYDGNVSSYSYLQMKDFGTWMISSTEFGNGPLSKNFVLPLVTLNLDVLSWDDQPVEDAYIKIVNSLDMLEDYAITRPTDINGEYVFYRDVNGTWSVDVWKHDDYPDTPVARNNTVSLDNIQTQEYRTIELALTRLVVQVKTDPVTVVVGAQVNITFIDTGLIAQGVTNSTGHVTFFNIHGNMSSPYSVAYNLTVKSGDQLNNTVTSIKCDYDWYYMNVIYITTPTYNEYYTELNATVYYISVKYGQNATFSVGYYDRDDGSTSAVVLDASSWVNFSIYLEGAYIGTGTWNFSGPNGDWVSQASSINYDMIVSTSFWGLDVSDAPYTIRINAHTDTPWLDPAEILIYITVQNGQTSAGVADASISEYYKTHDTHDFWLIYTTSNPDANLSSLTFFTYSVKMGASEERSGTLVEISHIYQLPTDALHGLGVGTYTLIVSLGKQNYLNQTVTIDVEITNVPMAVSNIIFGNYDWDTTSQSFTFSYIFNFDGNTTNPDLSGVLVSVQWITYPGGVPYGSPLSATLDSDTGDITFDFDGDYVPSGNWNISITCSKDNYGFAVGYLSSAVTVLEAPTSLTFETSSSINTPWQTGAVFEVRFARVSGDVGLESANLLHNWTDSVSMTYQGDGIYRITLATSIAADVYSVQLTLSETNHEDSTVDATITILIPLLIESEYASYESALEVYWTEQFSINVSLVDQSRGNVPVDGATMTYNWYLEFVVDPAISGTLTSLGGGVYNVTLNAQDAIPLDDFYTVDLTVNMVGADETVLSIFIHINAVPNEVVLPLSSEIVDAYYGDIIPVTFYWNNTLDNLPVTMFDLAIYSIKGITENVTTGVNLHNGWYMLNVDTAALGMNVDEPGPIYKLRIIMVLDGFQTHEYTVSVLFVIETSASLVIDPIENVNWTDSFDITARLYDAEHGGLIHEGAEVWVYYGDNSELMVNNGSGIFTVNIQSDDWFAASPTAYQLLFNYTLPNYVDSTNTSSVLVVPIPGEIVKDFELEDVIVVKWSETFDIRVSVNSIHGGEVPITYADVNYIWSGYAELHQLTYYAGSQDYFIVVDSSEVPANVYTVYIRVINENYTIQDLELSVTVNEIETSLSSNELVYEIFYGESGYTIYLDYSLDDIQVSIPGGIPANATVTMEYGGATRTAEYNPDTGLYELFFNPSSIDASLVPGVFTLEITAKHTNFTESVVNPTLYLYARTNIDIPQTYSMEEGQTLTISFKFVDMSDNLPIGTATVTTLSLVTPETTFSLNDFTFNETGGNFYIVLSSEEIGTTQTDAYTLYLSIAAPLYENQTSHAFTVNVGPATIDLLGFIPFAPLHGLLVLPVYMLQLILLMSGLFIALVGVGVGVRRYRIPHQIKQINKAAKSIENGKFASVSGIKNMGMVISE